MCAKIPNFQYQQVSGKIKIRENSIMSPISEYVTQDSGHSGLVAGMCKELKTVETIDRLSPPT